jgi:phosphohistidine phosphatase SixA
MQRRTLITAALLAPAVHTRAEDGAANAATAALLRAGGVVLAMRHALAPGTFDPPGFRLGDCSTQRNLNDTGRAQARRIGQWFAAQGLQPGAVRSSPWCRCTETAELAFGAGRVQRWAALGSPRGADEATNRQSLRELGQALAAATRQRVRFEVWVTHNFVLQDFAGQWVREGEGVLLRAGTEGAPPQVLGRLALA